MSTLPAFSREDWLDATGQRNDRHLADLLERLAPDERPRGVTGALIECDSRLREQIRDLREAIVILEARIADLEAPEPAPITFECDDCGQEALLLLAAGAVHGECSRCHALRRV